MMVELKLLNLHWLERGDEQKDLCAHSAVYLKIGDTILSDKHLGDWTVSAAAYYLLKTVKENYSASGSTYLIPHCGFTMWEVGEERELYTGGCDYGINWSITHSQNKVIHEISTGKSVETSFGEWRDTICKFSDEITNFYENSLPKIVEDKEDKKGFELFVKEWKRLRAEVFETAGCS